MSTVYVYSLLRKPFKKIILNSLQCTVYRVQSTLYTVHCIGVPFFKPGPNEKTEKYLIREESQL